MDGNRDIQKSETISRFFDKPAMRESLSFNPSVERLYRRSERIVAALFLATNHVNASESLRISIRKAGLELLDRSLSLKNEMRSAESENAAAFRGSARYVISLLRMLAVSGFLSIQNASVLIEAIDDLGNFLVLAQNTALSETVVFSREDFLEVATGPVKDIRDTRYVKDRRVKMSDTSSSKRMLDVRKKGILEILRSSGEIGIADIAASLPEYSTKMIQRELVELIGLGQVKKAGLKRWSRYSLAG